MKTHLVLDRTLQIFRWALFVFVMANLGAISMFMIATAWELGGATEVILVSLFLYGLLWATWQHCVPRLVQDWERLREVERKPPERGLALKEEVAAKAWWRRLWLPQALLYVASCIAGIKGSLTLLGVISSEYSNVEHSYQFALLYMVLGFTVGLYRLRLARLFRGPGSHQKKQRT